MSLVRKHAKEVVLALLILSNLLVWTRAYGEGRKGELIVSFLDVGQGDAVLIESPGGKRMLIDGGATRQVVSELGEALPFGDSRIDIVLATHLDKDHIGGLPEVFARFEVGAFIEPGTESDSTLDDVLEERVAQEGSRTLLARKGMVIDFGDGARFEVVFPDRDVSRWDTNDASIVGKLTYGESAFLFTGDSGLKTENILLLSPELIDVDVLKVGHHGSRTSTSFAFASAVSPEYAVISAGKGNSYGHPHKEVLDTLTRAEAMIKSTAESGTIVFWTDGTKLEIK